MIKYLIIPILLIWYGFNYTACMADHNTWPHSTGNIGLSLNNPQHMIQERGLCLFFSFALPLIPITTGGYKALRHNGFTW